jgi:2-polyprenyl-3-methyl-5-hydroxy-6-metoxy-1,4-benzoquinol methylase
MFRPSPDAWPTMNIDRTTSPPALRDCDLCGAPPARQRKTWPDAAPGSASAGYVTCLECGLVFANPLPAGDMAAFHSEQYVARDAGAEPDRLHKLDPEHSRRRLFSESYQRWARGLLEDLSRQTQVAGSGARRFLEVGCGAGGVVKAARDLGWPAVGTEVSAAAAEHAIHKEGLDIRVGLLEDLRLPERSFDIVLLHDVIEHVPSPMRLLGECARLLSAGGVLAAHTVNVDAVTVDCAGGNFFLADTTGGHCVLYTPATLRRYCAALGLEVVSIRTRGFRLVQRERNRERMGWKRVFIRLAENIGHEVVKRTGRGHFVMLVARKPRG